MLPHAPVIKTVRGSPSITPGSSSSWSLVVVVLVVLVVVILIVVVVLIVGFQLVRVVVGIDRASIRPGRRWVARGPLAAWCRRARRRARRDPRDDRDA